MRVRARVRVRVGVRARSHLNLVVSLRRGTDVSEPADVGTDLRLLPIGHGHVHLRRTLLLNGRTRGEELGGFGGDGFGHPRQRLGAESARPACPRDCRTGQSNAEEARNQGPGEGGPLAMLSHLARTRDLEPGVIDLDRPVRREGPDPVDRGQAQSDRARYHGGSSGRLARGVGRVEALHGGWGRSSRALPGKRQPGYRRIARRRQRREGTGRARFAGARCWHARPSGVRRATERAPRWRRVRRASEGCSTAWTRPR